jgi:hypothetical protein
MSTLDSKLTVVRGTAADVEFTLVDQFGEVEDLQGFTDGRVAFVEELGDAALVDKAIATADIEPGGRKGVVQFSLTGAETALFLPSSVIGTLELDVPPSGTEKKHSETFVVLVKPKVI